MQKDYRNLKWSIIADMQGKLQVPQTLIVSEYDQINPELPGSKVDSYYAFVNLTTHDIEYVIKNVSMDEAVKEMLKELTYLGFEFSEEDIKGISFDE